MQAIEIVRIYVREGGDEAGLSLMEQVFALLHDRHKIQGLTVFRGIAGFGIHGEVHAADLLHMSARLPLVIEFFDTPEAVTAALAALQGLIPSGHIVKWPALCL
ncbi:DUF190 domain-containing protein [Acidiferrobacter sp.]|uniref:DUF190 domain-containing protein n=1 Tax=Acidiferrobacter sp. TaxID=1872107 RepID=UPI00261DA179|nr:DUF190 domain-containing protein [Acidiferrobacter sp.]